MKKIFTLLVTISLGISAAAQNENAIKFLGIPIDGPKSNMISGLKSKGFKYQVQNGTEVLSGTFNGMQVHVYPHTNNGVLDRIYVAQSDTFDEAQIRVQYNNLLSQFQNNAKYVELEENQPIPDGEDISYEMLVHNKRYEATFYLKPQFSDDEVASIRKDMESMSEEDAAAYAFKKTIERLNGQVWFTVSDYYGKYYLSIYYDNLSNKANGEDL